jgi:hypothetical protein
VERQRPRLSDYLTYYGAQLLAQCKISGKEGESFKVGRLGDYKVGAKEEVVLGPAQIVTPPAGELLLQFGCKVTAWTRTPKPGAIINVQSGWRELDSRFRQPDAPIHGRDTRARR